MSPVAAGEYFLFFTTPATTTMTMIAITIHPMMIPITTPLVPLVALGSQDPIFGANVAMFRSLDN